MFRSGTHQISLLVHCSSQPHMELCTFIIFSPYYQNESLPRHFSSLFGMIFRADDFF